MTFLEPSRKYAKSTRLATHSRLVSHNTKQLLTRTTSFCHLLMTPLKLTKSSVRLFQMRLIAALTLFVTRLRHIPIHSLGRTSSRVFLLASKWKEILVLVPTKIYQVSGKSG
jgi:hypothetical protein